MSGSEVETYYVIATTGILLTITKTVSLTDGWPCFLDPKQKVAY